MKRRFIGGLALIVASFVHFPGQTVEAGGPSTICGTSTGAAGGYFCISKYPNANHSTDTSMTNGWKGYAPNMYVDNTFPVGSSYDFPNGLGNPGNYLDWLNNDSYSNSGGLVEFHVNSVRNRDNVNQRMMCLYNFNGDFSVTLKVNLPYSWNGWYNTSSLVGQLRVLTRGNSITAC